MCIDYMEWLSYCVHHKHWMWYSLASRIICSLAVILLGYALRTCTPSFGNPSQASLVLVFPLLQYLHPQNVLHTKPN